MWSWEDEHTTPAEARGSHPRPTETDCGGDAVDVDVVVKLGDVALSGSVTLAPHADGSQGYEPVGDGPDCWISHELLRALMKAIEPSALRLVLDTIEDAASYVVCEARGELPY